MNKMVIKGSLVDIQGTLLLSDFGYSLNQKLYDAMIEAMNEGAKIYIYSWTPHQMRGLLKQFGVDVEKFTFIPKVSLSNYELFVTGIVVDNENPAQNFDASHILPWEENFDFINQRQIPSTFASAKVME